ncbi:hypothetical protein ACSU1N_05345 [Thermogladius sp. 4427co]|uniref:hypothetical protein n=1 Tax=Thermogladius sp. 4427co TaxID=3450718 RepID=UPI003F7A5055
MGVIKRYCINWGSGGLYASVENDNIRIEGGYSIEVRTRAIIFENAVDYFIIDGEKKKYIYIEHGELMPRQDAKGCSDELELGRYLLRRVDLGFEEYLSIITPGESLVDYIVVTRKLTCIILSRKRQVFTDLSNNTLAIYLV